MNIVSARNRNHGMLFALLAAILVLVLIPMQSAFASGNDISASAVSSLTVSPSSVYDGDNVQVDVKFNDHNQKIVAGDVIRVSWTDTGAVKLIGFANKSPLYIKGEYVADVTITSDGTEIVFNKNVNKFVDVEGGVSFTLRAQNTQSSTQGSKGHVQIIAGSKTASVEVIKPASGVNAKFYSKTGYMAPETPDVVYWTLFLNYNKSSVAGDATIFDTLPAGVALDRSSFMFYITPGNEDGLTYDAFKALYPQAKLTINDNTFSVDIPRSALDGKYLYIEYQTKIVDNSYPQFTNHSNANYEIVPGEKVVGHKGDYTVQNQNYDAFIKGILPGEVKVLKTLAEDNSKISGVGFELTKVDGSDIQPGKKSLIITTNDQGVASAKNLTPGSYTLKEVFAPDWVDFDSATAKTYTFELKPGDTHGAGFMIKNNKRSAPKTISIGVVKYWQDKNGAACNPKVDSIEVELLRDGKPTGQKTTLSKHNNWKHLFKNLPQSKDVSSQSYTYSVREVGTQDNIITLNGDEYQVVINGNNASGFIITNKQLPKKPEKPVTPEVPTSPETPDTPNMPERPQLPYKPNEEHAIRKSFLPATGDYTMIGAYLVLSVGAACLYLKKYARR